MCAIAALPAGGLVVGGSFTVADGQQANGLARWDGSAWSPLGAGVNGSVYTLIVMPNGDLVAGGLFSAAGGSAASNIARWDGAAWHPLGLGTSGPVRTLLVMPDGRLIAGGDFDSSGGLPAQNLAVWDGATWTPIFNDISVSIDALALMPDGSIVAGGVFYAASGFHGVARWNGTAWSTLGSGLEGGLYGPHAQGLAVTEDGSLIAVGNFTIAGGQPADFIARWDGDSWSPMEDGLSSIGTAVLATPGGRVAVGGSFGTAGSTAAQYVAIWNGSDWSSLGAGLGGGTRIKALAVLPAGELVAGGRFQASGRADISCIAQRTFNDWLPLGSGMQGGLGGPEVDALAVLQDGSLVAGGHFDTAGGVAARNIARWDGTSWHPLGAGISGTEPPLARVNALAVLSNGDLVAAGVFDTAGTTPAANIARWDGAVWRNLGAGINGGVYCLAALPNGDLVAGGFFGAAGGVTVQNIARWDGSAWWPMGLGSPEFGGLVYALATLPSGDVIAGSDGLFKNIARWDGSAWHPLGTGIVGGGDRLIDALLAISETEVIAAGMFFAIGGLTIDNIARWDGASWSPLGSGITGAISEPRVSALARLPGGDLVAGGHFTTAGGHVSAYFARWGCPPCAADLNHDGVVDFPDYLEFLNLYDAGEPGADFTADGIVDFTDYLEFLNHYDAGC